MLDVANVKVYCRGVDLSTALQSTTLEQSREEQDETVYADVIRRMTPTLQRVALSHAGIFSEGPFTIGEVLRQVKDADDEAISLFPAGAIVGEKAFVVLAHKASISLPDQAGPGGLHKVSLRASSRMPVADGVAGLNGAISSGSQTAAYNLGALLAGQNLVATAHLLALSGSPNVTFILESDDAVGFPSAITRATSGAQTARGSVLLTAPGAIADNWWRIRWTFAGTGNFTAVLALGVAI